MQYISNDQTVRSDTVQDSKNFNTQPLATQVKKREQLVSLKPAIKEPFDLMGNEIDGELSTENDALKNEIGSYDEKWLEESQANFLKQIDDEQKGNLIMSRMQKQIDKQ